MTAVGIDNGMNEFNDIISLKLKKPKNWNWQLSTSKSSPHILLPVIKLYDYKGNLLLETKDTDLSCQRRSWHSGFLQQWQNHAESKFKTTNSERNCSDKREVCTSSKRKESISSLEKRRTDKNNDKLVKTFFKKIEKTNDNASRQSNDQTPNNIQYNGRKKTIVNHKENKNDLKKSKSNLSNCTDVETTVTPHHRRTRSDDVFRRKLKYNDEERAEIGYHQNSPQHPNNEKEIHIFPNKNHSSTSDDDKQTENSSKQNSFVFSKNNENTEITKPRYKTRTSSAGTLIIREETFSKPNRRRRPKQENTLADMTSRKCSTVNKESSSGISTPKLGDLEFNNGYMEEENLVRRRKSTITSTSPISYRISFPPTDDEKKSFVSHLRQRSDPLCYKQLKLNEDEKQKEKNERFNTRQIPINPFEMTGKDEDMELTLQGKSLKQQRKKKRKRIRRQRRYSDGSTSSTADNVEWKNRDGKETSATKACVKHKQTSDPSASLFGSDLAVHDGSASAADFINLVRHLSSHADRHVTAMGANVSRHSSKGLSGRRSQSSGSICNGKGKHEGKSCGSLPSYLDDRESGGCNNNDCEKERFDEVPRIPPLGDGAPLHWKFSDTQTVLCDQGYGSERSPEEEYPPPLPEHDNQCHHHEHHHLEPHACYPFITPESIFLLKLNKGSRGLGLSVTGGIDSGGSWPGLIRIKRLFPHQPASQCGLINVGDLLLEANGITLTGLTNYEALEVLRTASNQVELKICRPPPDVLTCVSPISEAPPPPPRREAGGGQNSPPLGFNSPEDDYYHGEFEMVINKIQGSLGFTLRKEDDSALGHYVRALVREPALTDGRIKAGDKIIAVNDVEISPMSHEQAVQFLRQCGEEVKLRLYRDAAQTPVAALSPTETTPRTSFSRKSNLRQEAVDMLNDIAVRKLIPGNQDTYRRSLSPSASPRRLRRQPYPSDASQETDHSSIKYPIQKDNDQFHEGLLHYAHPFGDDTSLFIVDSSDDCDKPSRPSSLDLYNPNQTPVVARKPRFNFSLAHNAYELNNLDAEVLDAPNLTYNLGNDEGKGPDQGRANDSFGQGPASMPHIPLENSSAGFSYKNPAYQTAHPPCVTDHEEHPPAPIKPAHLKAPVDDGSNFKKYKTTMLEDQETDEPKQRTADLVKLREENEVLAIELNRGWNSRLGFSLQGAAGVTYVSAVYANSVAAKDGRLKPGDRLIRVNDESVEHLSTSEIIDLLRIVRGPVCIVVSRTNSKEDCLKSNAEN